MDEHNHLYTCHVYQKIYTTHKIKMEIQTKIKHKIRIIMIINVLALNIFKKFDTKYCKQETRFRKYTNGND